MKLRKYSLWVVLPLVAIILALYFILTGPRTVGTLETTLILTIIVIQVYVYFRNTHLIFELRDFLPSFEKNKLSVTGSGLGSILVQCENEERISKTFKSVLDNVNDYLRNNRDGANDYFILRHMIEVEYERLSSSASQRISFPLYLGLGCTFIGIIFGLVNFAGVTSFEGLSTQQISELSNQQVKGLLQSVSFAMVGSAIGLILSLISSFLFSEAEKTADKNFNFYLNFIQSRLLPKATANTEGIIRSFVGNLKEFNKSFGKSLFVFSDNFEKQVSELKETTELQIQLLDTLSNARLGNMSSLNLKMLESFTLIIDRLKDFEDYISGSRKSIVSVDNVISDTKALLINLNRFLIGISEMTDDRTLFIKSVGDQFELAKQLKRAADPLLETVDELNARVIKQLVESKEDIQRVNEERLRYLNEIIAIENNALKDIIESKEVKEAHNSLKDLFNEMKYQGTVVSNSLKKIDAFIASSKNNQDSIVDQLKETLQAFNSKILETANTNLQVKSLNQNSSVPKKNNFFFLKLFGTIVASTSSVIALMYFAQKYLIK